MKRGGLVLSVAVAMMASSAQAQTVFSDNFNADGPLNTNFASFINWNVSDGSVDLIGDGFFDFYPGNGRYIDMDGSSGNAGTLTTKTVFNLLPGDYTFSFSLGKNGSGTEAMLVSIGAAFSENFNDTGSIATLTTITRNFTLAAPVNAAIVFNHAGGDNAGFVLDNVSLVRTTSTAAPEPATLALVGLVIAPAVLRRRAR